MLSWMALTWTNNSVRKSGQRHLEMITDVEQDEVRFCVFWKGVVFYSGTTSVMGAKNYTVYVYVCPDVAVVLATYHADDEIHGKMAMYFFILLPFYKV